MKITPFSEIARKMRAGDVIAFSGHSPISALIQLWTHSQISHVGIVVDGQSLSNPVIEEALAKSVTRTHIAQYLDEEKYSGHIFWYALKANVRRHLDYQKLHDFLYRNNHKPYDYVRAVESGLFRKLGLHESSPDLQKFFCSELVAGALQAGNVLSPDINIAEVLPADIVGFTDIFETGVQFK